MAKKKQQLDNATLEIYGKELHKPAIEKFRRRKVVSLFNNYIWAVDIAFLKTPDQDTHIQKPLLNVVDLYSRYAWSIPLTDKSGKSILKAFKTMKVLPKQLWVDQGGEFFNKEFQDFCDKKIL